MRKLLESIDSMSAAEKKPTGPRWPGYLKGTDSAKKAKDRMVGDGGAAESVEESENFLKELSQFINSNPVKRDLFQEWQEYKLDEDIISEYGAPGSGIGNDTATNPAEVAAKGQERKVSREQAQGQIQGLVAQITGLRRQLADLNKQFPQGANPVEKAMSLQQMQGQRNGIKSQIVDLAKQIAASRQQAT